KIAGVKACEAIRKQYKKDFVSLMPTNLYGPFDNFDLETSHVLPAMIRKFHDAVMDKQQTVTLWGSGSPMREFLHVNDMAKAVKFALENTLTDNLYNIGTGKDITIKDLAELIQQITGFSGEILWDRTKPDGTPRKLMDVAKMAKAGWESSIKLREGIKDTYEWFLKHQHQYKEVKLEDNNN